MKLILSAILAVSTSFASILWTGASGTDEYLETPGNWMGGVVPAIGDTADFDGDASPSKLAPQLSTTSTADFQCQAFNFESSSNKFSFTIRGPYSLNFYGDGITGTSAGQSFQTAYPYQMISPQQILFSQGTPSIGDATVNLRLGSSGSIQPSGDADDLALCLFDGSGGFTGGSGSQTVNLTGAGGIDGFNYGVIASSFGNVANDLGLVVFDGSGGFSQMASGSGHSIVTINELISLDNEGLLSNLSTVAVNDVGQLLFDGSGGVSFFETDSGGSGHSEVTFEASSYLSIANNGSISSFSNNGNGNDLGQIIFDGSSGLGYQSPGTGYSLVTFEDGSGLEAKNYGSIYCAVSHSGLNDLGQVIFDGSCGFSLGAIGASSESDVTLSGGVEFQISNWGQLYNSAVSGNVNDIAQLLFDGSAGFANGGGGAGHSTVLFEEMGGNSPLIEVSNYAWIYSNLTEPLGSVRNSVAINDLAQVLFDGSGGLGNTNRGTGNSNVTMQDAPQLIVSNSGSLFLSNYSYANDVGQIVFDGSGGLSFVDTGDLGGSGHGTFTIEGSTILSATNQYTMYLTSNSWANNLGQILFDGSGGANYTATSSGGPGAGNVMVEISGTTNIEAVNEESSQLSIDASSLVHHLGQIIFDGSAGLNQRTYMAGPSQGNLVVAISDFATISATNAGEILNAGTAGGVGQILFDGSGSSIGTGSCAIDFTSSNPLTATNSGTVQGDQFGIYGAELSGTPTFHAINTGTITHGVAFYGVNTTPALSIQLTGSSLYLDPGSSNPQQIGSVTFDASSTYEVFLTPGSHAQFNVTSATLAGSVALNQTAGNYTAGSRYLILQSTDPLSGSFSPTVIGALPGYAFRIEQTSSQVYLIYSAIPASGLSGNALKIANAINNSGDLNLLQYLDSLTLSELQPALNSISPARNAFGSYITSQVNFSLSQQLSDHIDALRVRSLEDRSTENEMIGLLADASEQILNEPTHKNPLHLWFTGFGELAYTGASRQNPLFHFNSGAVLLGLDYTVASQNLFGGAIGYGRTHFYENHNAGSGNINEYFASLYGNGKMGNFYLSPAFWVFFNQNYNVRHISLSTFEANARATISAWQIDPHLEVGYTGNVRRNCEIIPFSALDWVIQWQRGYREQGAAPFNASQSSHGSSFLRSENGLRFKQSFHYDWGTLTLKEKGSYVFEKPFSVGSVPTGFVGSPTAFTLTAVNQTLNLGAFGFDALLVFGEKKPFTLELTYEGEFGSRYYANDFAVTFGRQF